MELVGRISITVIWGSHSSLRLAGLETRRGRRGPSAERRNGGDREDPGPLFGSQGISRQAGD